MEMRGVKVVLCGVWPAFAKAMANVTFHDWLSADRIFLEEAESSSATLKAVRHVYELLTFASSGNRRSAPSKSLTVHSLSAIFSSSWPSQNFMRRFQQPLQGDAFGVANRY
jgi:hypothetical protein